MAYKDFGIALLLKQSNANYSLVTEFNILFMHILHISEYYISVYKTTFFPVHLHAYKQKPTPICNNGIASTRLALWLKWGRHAWGTALFSRGKWEPGSTDGCQAGRGHVAADVVCACGALLVVVVDCSDSFLLLFLGDPSSDCCAGARQQHEEERRPKRARY